MLLLKTRNVVTVFCNAKEFFEKMFGLLILCKQMQGWAQVLSLLLDSMKQDPFVRWVYSGFASQKFQFCSTEHSFASLCLYYGWT